MEPHPPRDVQHEWHHDQTHDVIDEECRENAASEDHRRQQVCRVQPAQHQFADPFKEAHQVQVADNEHHGEQQDNGSEVDEVQRLARAHDAGGNHGDGADDRRSRAVDLQPGKLAQGENQIAGEEDAIGRQQACVGEGIGGKMRHPRLSRIAGCGRAGRDQPVLTGNWDGQLL